jgi:hypothetical protein
MFDARFSLEQRTSFEIDRHVSFVPNRKWPALFNDLVGSQQE